MTTSRKLINYVFSVSYSSFSLYFIYYFSLHLPMFNADDGYILHDALRILNGEVIYKDFFQFYPPFSIFMSVFFLSLFGKSLFALTLAKVFLGFVIFITSYLVGKLIFKNKIFI